VPALVVGEVGVSADLGPSQVVESGNATSLGSVDDVPEAGLLFGSAGANAQQASEQISSDATPLTPAVDLPGLGEVDAAPETSAVDAKKTGAVPGSVLGSQNEAVPIGAQVGTGLTDAAGASAEQAQKVPDAAVGSAVVAETKSATGDVPILGGVNAKAEQLDDGLSSQEQLVASSEKPGANLTGADEAALDQAKPRRWKVNLPEIARAATAAPQGEVVVSPDAGAINAMAKADGMVSVNSAASAAIDMQALGANTAGVPQQVAAVDGDANAAAKAGEVLSGLTASKNSGAPGSGTVKQELSGAISDADGEVLAEDSEADLQSKPFSAAKPDAAEKAIPSGGAPVAGDKQARDGNAVTLAVTASSTNAASDDEAADDDSLNLPLNAKPFGSADATGTSRHEAVQTSIRAQTNPAAVQVAGAIAHNLKNGNTRFQMRFDPPELGRVDVHMKMSADGSVHAHLVVERPETLDMFLRDQRALERALVSAGLNTEGDGLQFSLQDSGGQGFGSSQDESFAEGREPGFGSNGAEEGGETLIKVSDVYLNNSPSGLDIRI
jgi:flagellar hook-length control protein FliK